MKKIISLILLAAVLLTLCACQPGKEQAKNAEGFCVGYSKVCIDPEEAVPLAGYGNHQFRYCTDIIDSIYATAVAVSDGQGNTVLLINTDMITTVANIAEMAQSLISEQTGIPGEQIIITSNHSHSVPDPSMSQEEASARYQQLLIQRISQAGVEAVADLQPATVSYGSAETVSMNFKRHYYMKDDVTGEISTVGDNFGSSTGKTMVGHTAEVDPTIYVVKFDREGDNDVLLCNWRAHPHFTGGSAVYDLSSDFVGPFRDSVERQRNCDFVFFQGACGNINPRSRIKEENVVPTKDYYAYGAMLAAAAVKLLKSDNMKPAQAGKLQTRQINYMCPIDHSRDADVPKAKEIVDYWHSTAPNYDKAGCKKMALAADFSSIYHCMAVIGKAKLGKEETVELDVLTIGDSMAFVTAPGELWDSVSVEMERLSPFPMSMTLGYANGDRKYFPHGVGYTYRSYESDYARLVPGTSDKVIEMWVDTLREFYKGG